MNLDKSLFIFEFANNHLGSYSKAKEMIDVYSKFIKKYNDFNFAIKFQYRDIKTFIHPERQNDFDHKYIKRFIQNQLSEDEFLKLKEYAKSLGFLTVCTPFNEKSVELIKEQNFDIIKIASCSTTDWSLLEKISEINKPIIISTAGSTLNEIDNVVNFFENRNKEFYLMHCVGIYPTFQKDLQLNQIDILNNRYSNIHVGFSTHENPIDYNSIYVAIAKGCRIFERHIDIEKENINGYSSLPENIDEWLLSAKNAFEICGIKDKRNEFSEKELSDLRQFKRGVFAKENLKLGEKLKDNIFYAFPCENEQLLSNDMSKYIEYILIRDINKNEKITFQDVKVKNKKENIFNILKNLKEIIINSNIILPEKFNLQLSHHYGIEKFKEIGVTIIDIINTEYCKKYLILFKDQSHPFHFHKIKKESFILLYGDMNVEFKESEIVPDLIGCNISVKKGEVITVNRGYNHNFSSIDGCVFEEISTTHVKDDSYYEDDFIMKNYDNRKTDLVVRLDWLMNLK